MKNFKRYTVTSALPYANGPIHIGHLAGVYLPADIYTRYLRLKKKDVIHICGSDEHGVPITLKAKSEGISPQEVVDRYHAIIQKSFKAFGIEFDHYSRTSAAIHHKTAQEFFLNLYQKNVFEEKISEQYYDEEAQQFLADRYIIGTCPKCGYENAYGDQCEKCGTSLSPQELKDPRSALSGNKPVLKETKHWYLPLDKFQEEWIEEWIDSKKGEWKPNVWGQCKSWLDAGLQPRAVTRDLDWGVPVPIENAEGKVLYVWFDAPIGYISATKEWANSGRPTVDSQQEWEKYWKDENTKLVHFIGKDNIVFHCIIFPAMLKAHGEYILPDNVPANEFLNLESNKLSTSRNWAVWLHEYLEEFSDKQDELRYVLCANMPETKDNDFTWKDYQARVNNELVAVLGNFVNRTLVLTHKYFEGKVPDQGFDGQVEEELFTQLQNTKRAIEENIEKYKFREALATLINLARWGNKYLAETEPWKLIKEDEKQVKKILYTSLELIANFTILVEPFLPFTAQKLKRLLNIQSELNWDDESGAILNGGHNLNDAELLFEKIADEQIEKQLLKLKPVDAAKIESKPLIAFEDFAKLDIRVGTIIAAEKVKNADKLLKLTVNIGDEQRTIVSGIAECYQPEQVLNRQVSLLMNLAPRKIRGVESQGMILMAEDKKGQLAFVAPDKVMSNSSIIR